MTGVLSHIKTSLRLRIDALRLARCMDNGDTLKIQFGCGGNVLPGWINTDLVPRAPGCFALDVRFPLPFSDESATCIYSEHFIEHLTKEESVRFLEECYRILTPGGLIRIGWPELSHVLAAYASSSSETWDTGNPASETACDKVNDCFYLYGHRYLYDYDTLDLVMGRLGFVDFTKVPWGESEHSEFLGIERNVAFRTHVIEARKPFQAG